MAGSCAAESLQRNFAAWRRRSTAAHLVAVALLVAVMLARWWGMLSDPSPHLDERCYFAAFDRIAAGQSPYLNTCYAYPPAFAIAGSWAIERLGERPVLVALRGANLGGLALALWCAMAWLPGRWRHRLLGAVVFLMVAPPVRFGVREGNLSLAVAGVVIFALLIWRRAPVASGLLMGASIAVKPLAPGAVLALLAHRPIRGGKKHWIAAAVAVAVSGWLILTFPYLDDLRTLAAGDLVSTSLSPHRIVHVLGIHVHAVWVSAVLALALVAIARRHCFDRLQFLCFALAAALATSPLVWNHTLLLALPLQVVALQLAYDRFRAARLPLRSSAGWEFSLVALAACAITLGGGASGIYDYPAVVQLFGALPPALAPALLAGYVIRHTGPGRD